MPGLVITVCTILGLAVGSFLNVVVWRVPRKESVVRPRSRCPECEEPIRPADNVPVVSWVLLRGRCRTCGARIPVRYPLVEVGCAVLFGALAARFWDSWALPAYLVLAAALLALSVIDLEHYLLPNRIVYPLSLAVPVLLAGAAVAEGDGGALLRALLGGAVAFVAFLAIHLVSPRGMGLGDVKLSFVLGVALAWLGWRELVLGLLLGFFYGALVGVALIALRLRTRKEPVPFGPFLAAGAVTAVLWGEPILTWYLDR
ncbi:MAG: prepilin peptidase [Acidimicrobiia bacterium]|nr:prepilin peptidase [Acidimicrobiia bacterium]